MKDGIKVVGQVAVGVIAGAGLNKMLNKAVDKAKEVVKAKKEKPQK